MLFFMLFGLDSFEKLKLYSPVNGYYSIVHVLNPESRSIKTMKIYHRDIEEINFFYFLGGEQWLMFESGEDQLIYAEFAAIDE